MAGTKVQASSDFFKKLSLEFQQLNHILGTLETFTQRAIERGEQLSDRQLLDILDHLEVFLTKVRQLYDRLEGLLFMLVVTP